MPVTTAPQNDNNPRVSKKDNRPLRKNSEPTFMIANEIPAATHSKSPTCGLLPTVIETSTQYTVVNSKVVYT